MLSFSDEFVVYSFNRKTKPLYPATNISLSAIPCLIMHRRNWGK